MNRRVKVISLAWLRAKNAQACVCSYRIPSFGQLIICQLSYKGVIVRIILLRETACKGEVNCYRLILLQQCNDIWLWHCTVYLDISSMLLNAEANRIHRMADLNLLLPFIY